MERELDLFMKSSAETQLNLYIIFIEIAKVFYTNYY
jgi:uncharacterized membrane protein YwzB